jgi:cytochrome P450
LAPRDQIGEDDHHMLLTKLKASRVKARSSAKPRLLSGALPIFGHTEKLLSLIARGQKDVGDVFAIQSAATFGRAVCVLGRPAADLLANSPSQLRAALQHEGGQPSIWALRRGDAQTLSPLWPTHVGSSSRHQIPIERALAPRHVRHYPSLVADALIEHLDGFASRGAIAIDSLVEALSGVVVERLEPLGPQAVALLSEYLAAAMKHLFEEVGRDTELMLPLLTEQHRIIEDQGDITYESLAHLPMLWQTALESERLHPSFSVLGVKLTQSVALPRCGLHVAADEMLLFCPMVSQRDERLFPAAKRFDVGRFAPTNTGHLSPLGLPVSGPHLFSRHPACRLVLELGLPMLLTTISVVLQKLELSTPFSRILAFCKRDI